MVGLVARGIGHYESATRCSHHETAIVEGGLVVDLYTFICGGSHGWGLHDDIVVHGVVFDAGSADRRLDTYLPVFLADACHFADEAFVVAREDGLQFHITVFSRGKVP